MRFAFLHVGGEIEIPAILVRSIRKFHPSAQIVQCTDEGSPVVPGVSQACRFAGDTRKLMRFRAACCAKLDPQPTLFLDTDMIVLKKLDLTAMLDGHDVAVLQAGVRQGAGNQNPRARHRLPRARRPHAR